MQTTSEREQPDENRREDDPVSCDTTSATAPAARTEVKPKRSPARTPEEQSVLDDVERTHGAAWVERHAELILEQARFIGNL
jgi:hypothetical protein